MAIKISQMDPGTSVNGTDLLETSQVSGLDYVTKKVSQSQVATYVGSLNLSNVADVPTSRTNLGLGTSAVKTASSNSSSTVASVSGAITSGHIATFADTTGTIQDGGTTSQFLVAANNLSDVSSVSTSRTNLGLGTGSNVQFGHLNNTPVGDTSASTGNFTALQASNQITSLVSTGTAPLVVSSTTRVSNLNAATCGTADNVVTNANLTGDVTSSGNATSYNNNVPLSKGGLNASLTANNGGLFYSTGSAGAILSGTATANQIPLSGSNAAPSWSTATYPATTTINQLLYSSSNNAIAGLSTGNSGVLATSSSGVPSFSTMSGTNKFLFCSSTSTTPVFATISFDNTFTTNYAANSLTVGSNVTTTGTATTTNVQTVTVASVQIPSNKAIAIECVISGYESTTPTFVTGCIRAGAIFNGSTTTINSNPEIYIDTGATLTGTSFTITGGPSNLINVNVVGQNTFTIKWSATLTYTIAG